MTVIITKLYDTFEQARDAVHDLEASGFSPKDVSVVASNADGRHPISETYAEIGSDAATGAVVGGGAGWLAGLVLLAIPGVGPVGAAGWLVATVAGAVAGAGAGGLIGSLVHHGVSKTDAEIFAEGVRRGGTLVSVKAIDDRQGAVNEILSRHKFVDPGLRGAAYRASGRSNFDTSAAP